MKTIFSIFILLIGAQVFASGPSTSSVDVEIMALASGETEVLACQQARANAIADVDKFFEPSEWTYEFYCGVDGSDEVQVKKSQCSCEADVENYSYNCLYEATAICYEAVWYD